MNYQNKIITAVQPRILRLRDAPAYLGMDKNRFNNEVRPEIKEIPIGKQGIAFDRVELDAWIDDYISRNGRPASQPKGEKIWDEKEPQDFASETTSGTSKKGSAEEAFAKALAAATSKKRN